MPPEEKEKNPEWFKTWFDSPYYSILYQNRNEEEAEQFLGVLLNYLHLFPGSHVLDAACGTGRYSLYLADKGFNVTGIDLSWKNIQQASLYESDKLSFFRHDMRELFYINYFDAVFNFFTSFGYFVHEKDDIKAIKALAHALKKNGRLIIDFFNTRRVLEDMQPHQTLERNGIQFHISKRLERNMIVKQISFQADGREHQFEEKVQALTLADFERYFKSTGLVLKEVFGDYDLNAFDSTKSERMIMVAEKA